MTDTETLFAEVAERLRLWRAWAQFVYCGGGGLSTLDDAALRAAVCAAHDKETSELKARVSQLEAVLAEFENHWPKEYDAVIEAHQRDAARGRTP